MRLTEFFHQKEFEDHSLVNNRSSFTPPKNRNTALDNFAKHIESLPLDTTTKPGTKYNISREERQAIRSLSSNDSIIIKEADKGGAVVIMDKAHYKTMSENILLDDNYYEKLDTDPKKMTRILYNRHIEENKASLTKKEYNYLKNFEIKESQFYGLPKVHKCEKILTACKNSPTSDVNIADVRDLKLRPIIAGSSCLTSRLSHLLDILLQPLTKRIPSFLKDTKDFLRKLPKTASNNTLLASFDVESLYSNINHELGLEAIRFWIRKYPNTLPERFSEDFILKSMKFILENNTFLFNNTPYRQIRGTAMGTKVAPVYATLTIAYLEQSPYNQISEEFGTEFSLEFEKSWMRFLDDCFILWTKSKEDLSRLHEILNNLNTQINFTMEMNQCKIPFLDCLVTKNGAEIHTDIYYKPTDSKTYLLFTSCHPKHTRVGVPFSLAQRLRTIISKQDTLHTRLEELKDFLLLQNYPLTLIIAGINKALQLDRQQLLAENNPPPKPTSLHLLPLTTPPIQIYS